MHVTDAQGCNGREGSKGDKGRKSHITLQTHFWLWISEHPQTFLSTEVTQSDYGNNTDEERVLEAKRPATRL